MHQYLERNRLGLSGDCMINSLERIKAADIVITAEGDCGIIFYKASQGNLVIGSLISYHCLQVLQVFCSVQSPVSCNLQTDTMSIGYSKVCSATKDQANFYNTVPVGQQALLAA